MHSDAWDERDMAVNLYKQNERFLAFFRSEYGNMQGFVERSRISQMMRGMIGDFAGFQREEFAAIIDKIEAWDAEVKEMQSEH